MAGYASASELAGVLTCACLLGGCFAPRPADGTVRCSPGEHACPEGYRCAADDTCWRDGEDHEISGLVVDLEGTGLVLSNDGEDVAIPANGPFTFARPIAAGESYAVSVKTAPRLPTQICTVTGGSGTASGDVTGITVTCRLRETRFLVGTHSDFKVSIATLPLHPPPPLRPLPLLASSGLARTRPAARCTTAAQANALRRQRCAAVQLEAARRMRR
jgi:hypothetical protein